MLLGSVPGLLIAYITKTALKEDGNLKEQVCSLQL